MSEREKRWYVASTGNHQGLVVEEDTGRNVAVCYDKADAPLLAAAPKLLEACKEAQISCESMRMECADPLAEELADVARRLAAAIAKAGEVRG